MLAYRGAGGYEIVPAYRTGTSTSPAPNTLTTTVANDYVISIYANLSGGARTLTANASTTSRANSSTTLTVNGLLIADELKAATGVTTARTATISASSAWSSLAISFMPARNVYWVGSTGTWDTTTRTNWSLTSGGTGGTSVPTIIDDVLIDSGSASSNGNLLGIALTGALNCKSITVSGASCDFVDGTSPTLNCDGGITLTNTCLWSSTGAITFTGTGTITSKGAPWSSPIVINGSGITVTLGDALNTTNSITVTQGTFDTASKAVVCTTFSSSNTNTRSITLGTSTVNLTSGSTTTIWDLATTTSLTFSGASSSIAISTTASATQTFAGGGLTYGKVILSGTGSSNGNYTFSITGANTFSSLSTIRGLGLSYTHTITFPAGVTTTFGLFLVQNRVVINSSSAGSAATLTYTGPGKCSLGTSVTSVKDINFSAASTFYVGAGATNVSGNTNVNFSTYILYWVGGNGTWDASSTTRWATSSGGAGGADVPSANTPAIVDGSSGSPTITLSGSPSCASLNTTGATCTFTSTGALSVYGNFTLTSSTTWSGSGALTLKDNSSFSIGGTSSRSSGCLLQCPLVVDAQGGRVYLASGISTVQNTLTLTSGILSGATVECTTFGSNNSNYRGLISCNVVPTSNNTTVVTMTDSDGFISSSGIVRCFYTGSSGTRTLDLGSTHQTRNLSTQIAGGTDTVTFTAGNVLGAISTAAQSSPYNSAFTGTFTNGTYLYCGNLTLSTALTFSSSSAFNIYGFTAGASFLTLNIATSLTSAFNFHGFKQGASFRTDAALTTTGAVSLYSAINTTFNGGSSSLLTCNNKITANSFLNVSSSVSGTMDLTGNSGTILDLKPTTTASGTIYNLIYSGSSGTRTVSVFGTSGAGVNFTNVAVNVTAGTDTVTVITNSVINSLDFTGFSGTFSGSGNINMGGQLSSPVLTFSSGMTQSSTYTWSLGLQSAPIVVTSNGKSFLNTVSCGAGFTPTITFADNFLSTAALNVTFASALTVNANVTVSTFSTQNLVTLNMGSGTWTLSGTGTVWSVGNGTINPSTSTIVLSNTSATARTFAGNGKTYYNLVIGGATGSSTTTFTGSNTFNQISSTKTVAHTLSFTASTTTTFTDWSISGTAGNLVTIQSATAANHTLAKAGAGVVSANYLSISRSTATPATLTWYAGANSTNGGNNSGWIFTAPPSPANGNFFFLFG
jgi:hypothetical protein